MTRAGVHDSLAAPVAAELAEESAALATLAPIAAGTSTEHLLAAVEPTSAEQMWQAVHELRLRQIELEVQNEELRRAQIASEAARTHYRELFETAPVGYLVLGDNGTTIIEANRCAAQLLGLEDRQHLLRQPLTRYVLREDQDRLYLLKRRAQNDGTPQTCVLHMRRPDQAVLHVQMTAAHHAESGQVQLRVVFREFDPAQAVDHAIASVTSAAADDTLRGAPIDATRRSCVRCGLRASCLPGGLSPPEIELLDRHIESPRPLAVGQILARSNDPVRAIYLVRGGALKSTIIHANGDRQIVGLYLPGELICPSALYQRHYRCEVEALQRSQLCALPCERMRELAEQVPALQAQFLHLLTREAVHDHDHLIAMGRHSARHRTVQFLCSLAKRRLRQHLDPNEILLPMTRADIGNFLNLAEETVCRVLARLQSEGILNLSGKRVQILDHPALTQLCEEPDERAGRASD